MDRLQNSHRRLPSLGRLAIVTLIWQALSACTLWSTGPTPSDLSPDGSTTLPETNVPLGTAEPPGTASQTVAATATNLPPYVYSLSARRVPEQGDLRLAGGVGGEFLVSIGQLAPGDYLILADSGSGVISTYSLGTGEIAALFRANLAEEEGVEYGLMSEEFVLAMPVVGPALRLYDLPQQSWQEIDPSCHVLRYRFSPSGVWIGAMCDDPSQLEAAPPGQVVMEAISTRDAIGVQFALPRSPTGRDLPVFAWIDDGVALVSKVWVEDEFRACAVSIDSTTMYCPSLGLGAMVSYDVDMFGRSPLIPFVDFDFPPRAALVPRECFEVGGDCPGVRQLQIDQASIVITSRDPEMIWWGEPGSPDATMEYGLIDLATGDLNQIASLGGEYSFEALCPDGTCMFLFQHDSEINWQMNSDGSLQVLPFRGDVIIGSFHAP